MTATDEPTQSGSDVTASELALGLLDGEERAAALRLVLSDPGFAAEVEQWRERFGEMFENYPEAEPPAHTYARLEAALHGAANDHDPPRRPPSRFLAAWAGVASLVAAALLLVVLVREPLPVSGPPFGPGRHILLAAIDPISGAAPMPALYDPASGHLTMPANPLNPPDHSVELWVIDKNGVPMSLGLMARVARTDLSLSPGARAHMTQGATIAASVEPTGGSPTGLPTGPIVAKGILSDT